MKKLVFGARQIGGRPSYNDCDEETALKVLEEAFTLGIRVFDTAPIYGFGKSEELLGKTFSSHRQDIEIITKFGFSWDSDKKTFFSFSSDSIQQQLEQSLVRLQTSYIDTYLLHIPEAGLDISEILMTLNSLKKQGIIRHYGVCNTYTSQLKDFIEHPLSQIEYVQDFYNILERKAESLIFPYLQPNIQFMAYGPLYRGIMTSLSMKELLEKDEDAINRLMKNQNLLNLYRKKQLYEKVATKTGLSLEKIAIDFLQKSPQVQQVIFGTKNVEHLQNFVQLFNL